nr:ABC transporter permease [Bradyrhizobium sp. Gha]
MWARQSVRWRATRFAPLSALALAWLILLLISALLDSLLSSPDAISMDLRARLRPPLLFGGNWAHILGTDDLGQDILARLLLSVRTSLLVALVGSGLGALLGTTLGFIAAHFRGWIEESVQMLVDLQAAMPFTIIALALLAFFGNSFGLFLVIMGIYGWERYARLARSLALSALGQGYTLAVRSYGAGFLRLYGRHVLPNVAGPLIVNMILNFSEVILLESALSFLGLGVQPPLSSLGTMVGYGRTYVTTAWWIAVIPGVVIVLTVLSLSILGDRMQDRLNPANRSCR